MIDKKKRVVSKDDVIEKTTSISNAEKEVLFLITEELLLQKDIAIRRRTSPQAVSKIVRKLKQKGFLDSSGRQGLQNNPPVSMKGFTNHKIITKYWRYHALHFVIKPYYFFPRYHQIRTKIGNYGINHREWTIKLHPDMVEIQLKPLEDFASPDKWEAVRKSETSFNKTLREISNKFGFSVWKEGKINIRIVNQQLARNPSELANARDGKYLTIRGYDDKIWFSIDKSKGNEHEYRHSDRALTDSEKVEPHLNDMLYNNPPTLSQIMSLMKDHININKETAAGLNAITSYIKSQLPDPKKEKPSKDEERPSYVG